VVPLTPENIRDGLIGGAMFAAFIGWDIWKRRKPRYIIDEHGERQRVIAWNRGQPVYDPKTWQQRIHEEAILRRQRRFYLVISAPFVIGPIWLCVWAYDNTIALVWSATFWLALFVAGPFAVRYFLPALFGEIGYQLGYQGMQGAKVLDRQPKVRPGREVVEEQKAHGDARVASEAEALKLLNSRK
jgi:hypothetical protein